MRFAQSISLLVQLVENREARKQRGAENTFHKYDRLGECGPENNCLR